MPRLRHICMRYGVAAWTRPANTRRPHPVLRDAVPAGPNASANARPTREGGARSARDKRLARRETVLLAQPVELGLGLGLQPRDLLGIEAVVVLGPF
jgi:hypothetical protein